MHDHTIEGNLGDSQTSDNLTPAQKQTIVNSCINVTGYLQIRMIPSEKETVLLCDGVIVSQKHSFLQILPLSLWGRCDPNYD